LTSNDQPPEAFQEPAYFSVTSSSLQVNEGGSISFNVESNQFGLTLDWQITGSVSVGDFLSPGLSGSLSLDSKGLGTVSLTLASDLLTEGPEVLRFALISELVEMASAEVTVVDTSVAPTFSPPVNPFFGGFFGRTKRSFLQNIYGPESVEVDSLVDNSQSIRREDLLGLFASDHPFAALSVGFFQQCFDIDLACDISSALGEVGLSRHEAIASSFAVGTFIAERITQLAPEIDTPLLPYQFAGLNSVQQEYQDFLNLYAPTDQYALT
jgi:hypothetical protein